PQSLQHALPILTSSTQRISNTRDVKGAATDASSSDSEIPTSAAFKAPQSLAPSPQKPQVKPILFCFSTSSCFSSRDMRSNTFPLISDCLDSYQRLSR